MICCIVGIYLFAAARFKSIDQLQNLIFGVQYNAYRALADMFLGVLCYKIAVVTDRHKRNNKRRFYWVIYELPR